ncbi:MAG: hypothetical protein COW84_01960 [Gammaproteobacteria bacterium CG22_combo_CG10-13_8_21_14_all_40_8]|nr:MAG: hypothetical protein COW84_01960 [Gammaproteobacteria bacterium CG22_combo_CG10-13_8_21_14_all_40_8]
MLKKYLSVTIACILSPSLFASPYAITDLGALAEKNSYATDVNNGGDVVGNFEGPTILDSSSGLQVLQFNSHGFIYNGIDFTDLGTLNPDAINTSATVYALNDSGIATGESFELVDSTTVRTAFIYRNAVMVSLGLPEITDVTSIATRGFDINVNNTIVGELIRANPLGSNSPNIENALIIHPDSANVFTILPSLKADGKGNHSARSINDLGQVVGWSQYDTDVQSVSLIAHATFYDSSVAEPQLVDLGTLGGDVSVANGINNHSVIVGRSSTADNKEVVAFKLDYLAGTPMESIGTLLPDDDIATSIATAINNNGQIVGSSEAQPSSADRLTKPTHGFLYQDGAMIDLNSQIDCDLGWVIATADSINDNGQIVGTALLGDALHAYLLTPTPNDGPAAACTNVEPPLFEGNNGGGGSLNFNFLFALLLLMGLTKHKIS